MRRSERRLAAIMLTDMVGYTALSQRNESRALELLEEHQRLLRPIFTRYHGREIKAIGDSFLVEFESALNATNCAIEIQQVLHDRNFRSKDQFKVRLRIGVHLGDVVHSKRDVLGDAVNVASRIEPLAEVGGVALSEQVFDQVRNKISRPLVKTNESHSWRELESFATSGKKKFGAILGDEVRTGINVSIFPGAKIGAGAWLGPGAVVEGDVGSRATIKAA